MKNSTKTSYLLKHAIGVTAIGRHSVKVPDERSVETSGGFFTRLKNPNVGAKSRTFPPDFEIPLSIVGRQKAAWSGKNLPYGFTVKGYHGNLPRQAETARIMVDSYPGKKIQKVTLLNELGFKWVKRPKELNERAARTSFAQLYEDWLEERIPTTIIEHPKSVGEGILKTILGKTIHLIGKKCLVH